MDALLWQRTSDIQGLGKTKPLLQKPPSLLELWRQLEDNTFTCLFWPAGIDNNKARCLIKFDVNNRVDEVHAARLELHDIIDYGLFKSASFITALLRIAQAFSCHEHRINEVMLYFAYCWVTDELLLDDFPGKKEWPFDEIVGFKRASYCLSSLSSKTVSDELICSIDRLNVYVDVVEDYERDELQIAILNLTMQWNAAYGLKEYEKRHKARSLRKVLRTLEHDAVPKWASGSDNQDKASMENRDDNRMRQATEATSTLTFRDSKGPDETSRSIGTMTENDQVLTPGHSVILPTTAPSASQIDAQISHLTFDEEVDRTRKLFEPSKIILETMKLLEQPITDTKTKQSAHKGLIVIASFWFLPGLVRILFSLKQTTTWKSKCAALNAENGRLTIICIKSKWVRRVKDLLYMQLLEKRRTSYCTCAGRLKRDWFEMSLEEGLERANQWADWMDQEPYHDDGKLKLAFQRRVTEFGLQIKEKDPNDVGRDRLRDLTTQRPR